MLCCMWSQARACDDQAGCDSCAFMVVVVCWQARQAHILQLAQILHVCDCIRVLTRRAWTCPIFALFSSLTPAACLGWHHPSTTATTSAHLCCLSCKVESCWHLVETPPLLNHNCMMASVPWHEADKGPGPLPSFHPPCSQPPRFHPATCSAATRRASSGGT
jgi:hypothetical protein